MAWLAFLVGLLLGGVVALFFSSHAIDRMIQQRIDAGAMHHNGEAYRIIPLEPLER